MSPDQAYERWKERRRGLEPPPGFADTVMRGVEAAAARRSRLARFFFAVAASRAARVGLLSVALVLFVVRLAAVLSVFVIDFAHPLE